MTCDLLWETLTINTTYRILDWWFLKNKYETIGNIVKKTKTKINIKLQTKNKQQFRYSEAAKWNRFRRNISTLTKIQHEKLWSTCTKRKYLKFSSASSSSFLVANQHQTRRRIFYKKILTSYMSSSWQVVRALKNLFMHINHDPNISDSMPQYTILLLYIVQVQVYFPYLYTLALISIFISGFSIAAF